MKKVEIPEKNINIKPNKVLENTLGAETLPDSINIKQKKPKLFKLKRKILNLLNDYE